MLPAQEARVKCIVCGSPHFNLLDQSLWSSTVIRIEEFHKQQTWTHCEFCTVLRASLDRFIPNWREVVRTITLQCGLSRIRGFGDVDPQAETIVLPPSLHPDTPLPAIELYGSDAVLWNGLGSLVEPTDSFVDVTERLTHLLTTCQEKHQRCRQSDQVLLPKRVLDVGSNNENIRLWETNGSRGKYLTLSHRWSQSKMPKTESASFQKHINGIEFEYLPATFQDAIVLTRSLGFRFLWVDALCIIQDSPEDWEVESAAMAAIYMNTSLTIMAASSTSTSVEERLLMKREPPLAISLAHLNASNGHIKAVETVGGQFYPFGGLHVHHLNWRAWILQEQALSQRLAVFTSRELFWECGSGVIQETHPHGSIEDYNSLSIDKLKPGNAEVYWQRRIEQYSSRDLRLITDKLPALSGLAPHFQRITGFTYHAGIWTEIAMSDLIWVAFNYRGTNEPLRRQPTVAFEYVAPTWSWASISVSVRFMAMDLNCEPLASITRIHTDTSERAPFGRVRDGCLHITGLMLDALIGMTIDERLELKAADYYFPMDNDTPLDVVEVFDEVGAKHLSATRAAGLSGTLSKKANVWEVEVSCLMISRDRVALNAIVLGRSPARPGFHQRLGLLDSIHNYEERDYLLQASKPRAVRIE